MCVSTRFTLQKPDAYAFRLIKQTPVFVFDIALALGCELPLRKTLMKSKVSSELGSWIATKPAVGITHFWTHRLQRLLRLLLCPGGVQNLIGCGDGWAGIGCMRGGMSPGKSAGLVSRNQYRNTVNETTHRPAQ